MTRFDLMPPGLARALARSVRLNRALLWVERLARALWPAFSVACIALGLGLLGAFEALAPGAHTVALWAAVAVVLAALGLGLRGFRVPGRAEAVARLEARAPARPLSTLTDELAAGQGSDTSRRLWEAHLARAARAAAALRTAPPDLRLSGRDRWALRLFAPVFLLAAFIGAGGGWSERLEATVAPAGGTGPAAAAEAERMAEAWAVPPGYTGEDTVYLDAARAAEGPVDLPEGSVVTIRVSGVDGAPGVAAPALSGLGGVSDLGGGLYEAVGELTGSGAIAVTEGDETVARWQVAMIPDEAPAIALDGAPRPSPTRALEVPFTAADDHGVAAAWAEIRLPEPLRGKGLPVEPVEFGLPLPLSGDLTEIAETAVRDLTDHPWAGAEVELVLKAEDGAGQVAATEPRRITLPGRLFLDPLAKSLVEQRRALVLDYGGAARVLDVVQAVTRKPEDVFDDNMGAYLMVRTAVRRLAHAIGAERVPAVAPDVIEALWQAALAIEEGDLSSALERLRQAEERLRRALESGTDEEVRRAIEELRQAMNEYLQQLARQGMQQQQGRQQQMPPDAQTMTQQDLQEMLDQMQRSAESGMRDQAEQMLSQLSQMLQNLRPGGSQQAQPGQGQRMMQQLQDMIQRQRELSDQTFDEYRQSRREGRQGQRPGQQGQRPGQQQGQQGQGRMGQQQGEGQQGQRQGEGQRQGQGRPGGQGGEGSREGRHGENGRLAAEQEALRNAIEELRRQLEGQRGGGEGMDGASRALGEAGRAMGEARDDLRGNRSGEAVEDQMEALDRLNEGAQSLAEAMEQQGQGQQAAQGRNDGDGRGRDRRAVDPFDRPTGSHGAVDGTGTDVPEKELMDRARELMQELRRRAGQQSRPELERDYLERLIDRF